MNTPFSRPDLSRFIQEGTDAAVSKVTFPDGTQQSTSASPRPTAFTQSDAIREFTVLPGNPNEVTNPGNNKQGAVTELSTSIVLPEANQNVFINCRVVGELDVNSADFGMILHRSGGTGGSKFLRAAADGDRGRFISPNVISMSSQDTSTLDTMIVTYVDTTTSADTYTYTPVCVNTGAHNKDYRLNKVQSNASTLNFEVAISTMVLQVI